MSILFRAEGYLTLDQLTRAWGCELAKDQEDPEQVVKDLRHILLTDIVNGRLDGSGPLRDGQRLGLRFITPENRAGFIEGRQLSDLLHPQQVSWMLHYIVVMKEAVLDFAGRRELPPPTWWTSGTTPSTVANVTGRVAQSVAARSIPPQAPSRAARPRGRRPKKLEHVIKAITGDIHEGRLTTDALSNKLQKELADEYGVSRETACKARDAVLFAMQTKAKSPFTSASST